MRRGVSETPVGSVGQRCGPAYLWQCVDALPRCRLAATVGARDARAYVCAWTRGMRHVAWTLWSRRPRGGERAMRCCMALHELSMDADASLSMCAVQRMMQRPLRAWECEAMCGCTHSCERHVPPSMCGAPPRYAALGVSAPHSSRLNTHTQHVD